ncbi:MAG TPA: tyrosine-protein phosphatase [Candidatus Binataceae bacterium]|nr:tyrosine-protein phosphatase [Candidatus Binataceae bacterium]
MADTNDPAESQKLEVVVDFDLLRGIAARNFRDLGGHPVADGRKVRPGHVYRSSHLAQVPRESPISTLKLKTLITLQSRMEVKHIGPPAHAVRNGVRWEHIPIGDRWFTDRGYTRTSVRSGLAHLDLVMHFREDWQRFFKLLAERNVYPLLFHCSAGRDRTGVGAAMLLEVLGVERARIVADFLESNTTFPQDLLTSRQLAPVFESIDEAGGIDAFMREVLGLDSADLESIRADLLEK